MYARRNVKQQIILPGQGKSYDWSKDHVFVKSTLDLSDGRLTLVEDTLKPGFFLGRHHHKKMIEIFYILDGSVEFVFDDERVTATKGTTCAIVQISHTRSLWRRESSLARGRHATSASSGSSPVWTD